MGSNEIFISAHIFIVLLMFLHVYLNIYEIDKLTYLHEKKKIKIGKFKYLFPSYKSSDEIGISIKTFINQLGLIVLFVLMTTFMIISLFHLLKVKAIILAINSIVLLLLTIYTTGVKNKYKRVIG